jgi:molybdopterin molybdotransferase
MEPKELIPVAEARTIIAGLAGPLGSRTLPIEKANGLVLSEDIFATIDIPGFDQSSMDGYAVRFEDISGVLVLQAVIPAGASQQMELAKKHAMRIFTGAPVPQGADTVIMQEKTSAVPGGIRIEDRNIEKGTHIRMRGADIKSGDLVMQKGTLLSATKIALLASMGIAECRIFPPPSVTIIATGREIQKPGNALGFGQVYESNTYFLEAALEQTCIRETRTLFADDELAIVQEKLARALKQADIVLLTGGVSVGDYDFVRSAADLNGIDCRFHKVKQKPGKPFYFGTKENQLIFGLPGNPASVITCFYEYILPALEQIMQRPDQNKLSSALLVEDFRKAEGLTQFLKGYEDNGSVSILAGQESFRLRSFSQANCLVALEEQRNEYKKGEKVSIRRLPF